MRSYTTESYKELVENIDDKTLQRFMRDEQNFIVGVENVPSRTFVDLGAGSGRVVPFLSEIARDVVAIEINPDMYKGLELIATELANVKPIEGDFLKLGDILPANILRPAFLMLQNTLGTIEGGDSDQAIEIVINEAKKRHGELLLALFRQPALKTWGVSMYGKLRDMVGNVDMQKSDFNRGLLVTDIGYTSKWWTDEDIAKFRKLGTVIRESETDEYIFLQIGFSN